MPSIVHQMIEIYTLMGDFFKTHPALAPRYHSLFTIYQQ